MNCREKCRLRADLSYIWAHNPEDTRILDDAEVLIVKLLERLRASGGGGRYPTGEPPDRQGIACGILVEIVPSRRRNARMS